MHARIQIRRYLRGHFGQRDVSDQPGTKARICWPQGRGLAVGTERQFGHYAGRRVDQLVEGSDRFSSFRKLDLLERAIAPHHAQGQDLAAARQVLESHADLPLHRWRGARLDRKARRTLNPRPPVLAIRFTLVRAADGAEHGRARLSRRHLERPNDACPWRQAVRRGKPDQAAARRGRLVPAAGRNPVKVIVVAPV